MRAVFLIGSLLAAAPVGYGQIESDTLTIHASRSIRPSPDQVVFQLLLLSDLNTGFEDVVAALPGLAITPANLIDHQGRDSQSLISWVINLAVPLDKLKKTAATLRTLQQRISETSGMMLSFGVIGSQVSSAAIGSQPCSTPGLIADARQHADQMAVAAGLIAGPILAMSDGNSGDSAPAASATFELLRIADPLTGMVIYPYTPTILTRAAPDPFNCTAEVTFRLLRYQ